MRVFDGAVTCQAEIAVQRLAMFNPTYRRGRTQMDMTISIHSAMKTAEERMEWRRFDPLAVRALLPEENNPIEIPRLGH